MASIIPIGDKYRAQVRRKGHATQTQTFDTKKEAQAWARKIESDIDGGKKVGIHGRTGITVAKAVERITEETPGLGPTPLNIYRYIARGLGDIFLDKLSDDDIVNYFRKRKVGPMSVSMEMSYLSTLLTTARLGWKYHVPNILDDARARLKLLGLIGTSNERDRRPTPEEIKLLCAYDFHTSIPMADIIMFAISSAMRQAEITRIKWPTYDRAHKTVVITDRKHPKKKKGNHKTVPLLDESVEIIDRQPKPKKGAEDQSIFPYKARTIGTYFTNACRTLGIEDLHFHDLRHEGTSRLFEMGYQIHEVAMFTGHEDWKQLKRYTQLKAKDVRRLAPIIQIDEARRIKELEEEIAKLKQSKAA